MRRRAVSPFSLAFLDIMFCGFGAVVLLVLILNTDTVRARNAIFADLRSEVVALQQAVFVGTDKLAGLRDDLQQTDKDLTETTETSAELRLQVRDIELETARLKGRTSASRRHIERLQSDLKSLDQDRQRLSVATPNDRSAGEQIRQVTGDGDRQYLTGLKVGGKRVLILVDASASMLDETVVNVIRRRHMDNTRKRGAAKWRRALASAEWLVSNLPSSSKFQLYSFNTAARAALSVGQGRWLSTTSREDIEGALNGLYQLVPDGGTSLYHAFAVAKQLTPGPDNILLITDGLPTQGRQRPSATTVSGEQRLRHLLDAGRVLPAGVPVNTILLPMEGDAYAAAAFWRLALDTHGSMITPARDWP